MISFRPRRRLLACGVSPYAALKVVTEVAAATPFSADLFEAAYCRQTRLQRAVAQTSRDPADVQMTKADHSGEQGRTYQLP